MKYLVLVPDGASDYPLKELNNKTPLQVANMPNIDKLANNCELGLAQTIPDDFSPGSDVANLNILGYDPCKYFSGRGPIEAAYHGLDAGVEDTVFRCNLITVDDGKIVDHSASHIDTDSAAALIKDIDKALGTDNINFYSGVSYRHLTIFKDLKLTHLKTLAPHDVIGKPLEELWPQGQGADLLIKLIKESNEVLRNHPINKDRVANGKNPANYIWFWGSGQHKDMPSFKEKFGLSGAVISAVDLIKGLGVSMGLEVIEIPTATGYFDTDYEAKAAAAIEVLKEKDFVYVHVEAPDEAGHVGNLKQKIASLEDFDKRLVGNILKEIDLGQTKIMVLPDHATPIPVKTHTRDPIPYLIYPGKNKASGFNEEEAKTLNTHTLKGYELMSHFIAKKL